MRKIILQRLICIVSIIIVTTTVSLAQNKPKRGTFLPKESPEQAVQDDEQEKKEKTPKKPLNKQQGQRAMKEREKTEDKNYEEHHERIQQEDTYKRMKKNKKRAKYVNANKRPNVIQRILLNKTKK